MEAEGSPHFSTPKKEEEPVIPQLAEHIKSLQTSELKQILAAISKEMDARHVPHRSPSKPDASGSQAHKVSSFLHSLIKEGALSTNIPKLSVFSGNMMKGEASFEQWSYELQMLRKTYSESALREGIQRSLKRAAVDTVHNMGPDTALDTIIKKFSIIYGNVKSYDILMGDFYRADQGEDKQLPPLLQELRASYLMSGTNSLIKFLSPGSRNSLKTDCSMAVRRVYEIV